MKIEKKKRKYKLFTKYIIFISTTNKRFKRKK